MKRTGPSGLIGLEAEETKAVRLAAEEVEEGEGKERKERTEWAEDAVKGRFYFAGSFIGFCLKIGFLTVFSGVMIALLAFLPWWIVTYFIGNVRAEFELNEKLAEYIKKIAQRE